MAVAARAIRRASAVPSGLERARLAAWPFLAGMVAVSFAVRAVLGWLRETPI